MFVYICMNFLLLHTYDIYVNIVYTYIYIFIIYVYLLYMYVYLRFRVWKFKLRIVTIEFLRKKYQNKNTSFEIYL